MGSQTLTLSGTGTAAQSNAGNDISVNVSGFSIANGSNGGLAANYTFSGGTHTVDLTATQAYITGTRAYDGSLTVQGSILRFVDPNNLSANVSISGSATASSANAANGVTITQGNLGTLALGGSDAGSYNINTIATNGYVTVDITPKAINLGAQGFIPEPLLLLLQIFLHPALLDQKH